MGIFTSDKRLDIDVSADSDTVIQALQEQLTSWSPWDFSIPPPGSFTGTIANGHAKVQYRCMRNPLKPTLHLVVDDDPSGGSVIHTWYTTYLIPKLFLTFWFCGILAGSIGLCFEARLCGDPAPALFGMAMPLLGVGFMFLSRHLARFDEERLESFAAELADNAETAREPEHPQALPKFDITRLL